MMATKDLLRIVVIVAILGSTRSDADYCFSKWQQPYIYFGPKTSYEKTRGSDTDEIKFPGCEPAQLYFIGRHGTRYPNKHNIKSINEILPKLLDSLIKVKSDKFWTEQREPLKSWRSMIDETYANELTPSGIWELQGIGRRFRYRFPSLLKESFHVRFSSEQRTNDSARNFLIGAFGPKKGPTVEFEKSFVNDSLTRIQTSKRDPTGTNEHSKFLNGAEMKRVKAIFGSELPLTQDDVKVIYEMCRYEAAWHWNNASPWCFVFQRDHLQILEYLDDLQYYEKNGYGNDSDFRASCVAVADLVNNFKDKILERDGKLTRTTPYAVLRFSHSSLMMKLLTRLGLYEDELPLRADNYDKQAYRKWRTSKIDTFATNLAFVLLDCEGTYRIATYHQEKKISLPGQTDMLITWEDFMKLYAEVVDNCNCSRYAKKSNPARNQNEQKHEV